MDDFFIARIALSLCRPVDQHNRGSDDVVRVGLHDILFRIHYRYYFHSEEKLTLTCEITHAFSGSNLSFG